MEKKNKELRELVIDHKSGATNDVNSLGMKLNGIIDAAVNGK